MPQPEIVLKVASVGVRFVAALGTLNISFYFGVGRICSKSFCLKQMLAISFLVSMAGIVLQAVRAEKCVVYLVTLLLVNFVYLLWLAAMTGI